MNNLTKFMFVNYYHLWPSPVEIKDTQFSIARGRKRSDLPLILLFTYLIRLIKIIYFIISFKLVHPFSPFPQLPFGSDSFLPIILIFLFWFVTTFQLKHLNGKRHNKQLCKYLTDYYATVKNAPPYNRNELAQLDDQSWQETED